MPRLPDFIIIGAMKCATSTLHEQLAQQPGVFMSTPKEPNFFSDDEVYAKGMDWYHQLFSNHNDAEFCGESSTHYTKLPTYPETVNRLAEHVPDAKFIYVMRHPIDRLVSQHMHEWTKRLVTKKINKAIHRFEPLIAYSQYARQLKPFIERFGCDRVLPVFFENLRDHPQQELERVCQFLGYPGKPVWRFDMDQQNVSSKKLRTNPIRDWILSFPGLRWIRLHLVPQSWRDTVKRLWTINKRPKLSKASIAELTEIFNEDLAELGQMLGLPLRCDNFVEIGTSTANPQWAQAVQQQYSSTRITPRQESVA